MFISNRTPSNPMANEAMLHQILGELKEIKISIGEIDEDIHYELNQRYLKKLKRIEAQPGLKFRTKEELLQYLKRV